MRPPATPDVALRSTPRGPFWGSARWGPMLAAVPLTIGCGAAPAPVAEPRAAASSDDATEELAEVSAAHCGPAVFDAAAHDLREYFCTDAEGSIAASEIDSCDEVQVTLEQPAHRGRGLDARVVQLATPTGRVFSLLVCADGRTEAFLLEDLWSYTDEEATTHAEGTVSRMELLDLTGDGASELRLDVTFTRSRVLWHGCIVEDGRTEHTIVCAGSATGPRCADVRTLSREEAECDELCLIRQLEADEPDCEAEGTPSYQRELQLGLELRDGRARVTESRALDIAPPDGLLGDHTIEELLALGAMEPLTVLSGDE